jgi:hypothetical protein
MKQIENVGLQFKFNLLTNQRAFIMYITHSVYDHPPQYSFEIPSVIIIIIIILLLLFYHDSILIINNSLLTPLTKRRSLPRHNVCSQRPRTYYLG